MCIGSIVFCCMSKSPANLALTRGRNVRFNLTYLTLYGRLPFPPVFGCIFEIVKYFLSKEHEQVYGSICSIGEDQRDWIKEGN